MSKYSSFHKMQALRPMIATLTFKYAAIGATATTVCLDLNGMLYRSSLNTNESCFCKCELHKLIVMVISYNLATSRHLQLKLVHPFIIAHNTTCHDRNNTQGVYKYSLPEV